MGKSIKSEMVPLIKQPVDVILATARAAGRAALVTRAIVEEHRTDISLGWFNSVMPSSLGVMDDDAFSDLMAKMGDAFDEGWEEYFADCKTTSALQREVRDEQFDKQCAAEILYWAAGIFEAIKKAAMALPDGCNRGHIIQLAECGDYLASDRAEVLGYTGGMNAEASDE